MVMAAQDVVTDMVVDDEALAEWLCRWLWQHRMFVPIWWWNLKYDDAEFRQILTFPHQVPRLVSV